MVPTIGFVFNSASESINPNDGLSVSQQAVASRFLFLFQANATKTSQCALFHFHLRWSSSSRKTLICVTISMLQPDCSVIKHFIILTFSVFLFFLNYIVKYIWVFNYILLCTPLEARRAMALPRWGQRGGCISIFGQDFVLFIQLLRLIMLLHQQLLVRLL